MFTEDPIHQPSQLRDIGALNVSDVVGELQVALHAGAGVLVVAGDTMAELSESLEELVVEASRQFPDLSCVLFTPEHPEGAIGALEEALRALLGRQPEEALQSPPWEIVEASLLRGHLPESSPRLLVVDRLRELFHESEADVSRFCRSLSRWARLERMSVVVGVIREDLDKLRAIAGLLPSLQPAVLPSAFPAPLPGSGVSVEAPEDPTSIPAPEPELILEPTHIWAAESETEGARPADVDTQPAPSLILRQIEPLPEAFFHSDVLQTWDAEPVQRPQRKAGGKRSVHLFELLLVSTAVALLVYFLPLRDSAPMATPVPSPAPTEFSSIPEASAATSPSEAPSSAALIPVSGLPKEAPTAQTPEAEAQADTPAKKSPPIKSAIPVAAPATAPPQKPVQTSASLEQVSVNPPRQIPGPAIAAKPVQAPVAQPPKALPPPAPVAAAPKAPAKPTPSAPKANPKPTQGQARASKPPLEPTRKSDPVSRLSTELKKSPPATFGDVAVLAENLSQSVAADAREDLRSFLADRFFSEEHFALAMGKLFADARVDDAVTANQWFQKAVDRDLAGGMTQLGVSHLLGRGLPQNTEEGYRWLVRARAKNDGAGAFLAAICRMRGTGATQNLPMARELLNVAIDQKCIEAYWESSWMHAEGLGGATDKDWAFHLCRIGAAHGEAKCVERLALHYETGDLTPKDLDKAVDLRAAASTARSSWLRNVASQIEKLPMDHPAPAPSAETVSALPLAWLQLWSQRTHMSFVRSLTGWHTAVR